MKKVSWRFLIAALGAFLVGVTCNFFSQVSTPPAKTPFTNPCLAQPDLGFNIEAASVNAAVSTDANGSLIFAALGIERAQKLADELRPVDTFCNLAVSPATQTILNQADLLIQDGKSEEAQTLLVNWLTTQRKPESNGNLYMIAQGIPNPDRQMLRDILQVAEKVELTGGDVQPFLDYAVEVFRSMAAQELPGADFKESMRIADEAFRLGQTDIGEQALQQAQKIWAQMLDNAIANFNLCTAQNDDIEELLDILGQAIMLGINGTNGPDGDRYAAVFQKVGGFFKLRFGDDPWPARLPDYEGPAPTCKFAELEVRLVIPGCTGTTEAGRIPLSLTPPSTEAEDLYFSEEEKAYYFVEGQGPIKSDSGCGGFRIILEGEVSVTGSYEGLPPNTVLHLHWPFKGLLKFYCPPELVGAACVNPGGVDPQLEFDLELPLVDGARQEIGAWEFILHLIEQQ